jgi:hypothetical protein
MKRRVVILVEGTSDRLAVEALAARRGRDLDGEGITISAIGGATNIQSFLDRYGPRGLDVELAGLCDAGEEPLFRRALERSGFGATVDREAMESLGFFVCTADLEDELIRAVGPGGVERIIEAEGELRAFRTFQKQEAQQARSVEQQLRRFMGTRSGRKYRYAQLLADAVEPALVPRPLDRLLAHV